ncbi:cleavage and polyadenylation specificity factor subunit 4 isoform X5 [Callorhinus ursinus]|uniref:Cleavage and polyadenylation specificity factor subunit 4 n=2 Tax=Otariidae TaxID=9702 RepID=A0A3Q7NG79_CALUR|nr:cleavage and polyadenylation specificity factor subunit 4 isoform X5 [Callorhinus ursinus]XP_027466792.1 cleavage and polyadenylation specificity factor subunit 4 isoform X6 [Zalophus californianus]XP_027944256.1 cleavage and polyadenylation specificity factor subunit 4 isoform X5 [Eumetopias jubatus]
MQEIIASVDHIKFDLEIAVEQQLGAQPLPFPGMDKSGAAVCEFFLKAACGKGGMCPFRHISGEKTVVCKHWLRGLCKKGDQCEFLHEYDMTKMPECYFYSKFGECSNKECPFLHIDPESKIKDCPWYDRGFCKHALDLNCQWEPPSSPHCHSRRSLRQSREPRRSSGSCRVKTAAQATGDPGRWSRSPVTSVARKDTTPTDAPKGTWPFSVDSDSSWSQLRAAQGPRWERALNCFTPVLVPHWLGLAGRHTGVIVLRGYISFPIILL